MDDLKDHITQALEKKGVLAKLRAELRANVFSAIDEHDGKSGGLAALGSERSSQFHSTAQGQLAAELVREYLEWCELEYTLKVFLPEVNNSGDYMGRAVLEDKLGMKPSPPGSDGDKPILALLLESLQGGGGGGGGGGGAGYAAGAVPMDRSPPPKALHSPEASESPNIAGAGGAHHARTSSGASSGKLSPESASSPFMVTREGSAFVKDSLSDDMYSTVQHQDGGGGGEGAAAGSRAAKHEAYAQALRLEDQVEHMHDHEEPAEAPAAPSPLLGKLDPLPGLGKLPGRGGALEPLAPLRTGMGGGALGSPGGLAPLRNPPGALGILPGAGAGGGGEEEGGLGKSKSSSHVSPRGLGGEEESDVSIGEELEVEDDIVVDDDVSEDSYVFADDQHTSLMSKGQSMDLMASGLSASDRSGELDDNDFMESAEMSSMGL